MIKLNQFKDAWDAVELFEEKVSKYAGSKYAVSTDNCTDALFLCLKYFNQPRTITIPKKTYLSVPQTIIHAGYGVMFDDIEWSGVYQLKPFPIWDGATRFKKDMYKGGYHCLSFHIKKHIPIGKGGMILTDDIEFRDWARKARYEGRNYKVKYEDDRPDMIGWNMYMYPEQAVLGLELLDKHTEKPDCGGSDTYYDLSTLSIWND
tara:strand:- start:1716 stop:2330 length:615 start_codon:yes stop_codon:yes gene_type:complete